MLQRIRLALQEKSFVKLGGPGSEVEVDETFIGGKARFMHKDRRIKTKVREGNWGKAIVMGMLERNGKVKATVIADRKKAALHAVLDELVDKGSLVYTDEHQGYQGIDNDYLHKIVNHLDTYVQGTVHTQGMENFWSLLKRGLGGTYISVEPFHLFRYIDEEPCRFNNREMNDAERFALVVSSISGKRLTYAELTGKVDQTETEATI
jgi:transposase-like protein